MKLLPSNSRIPTRSLFVARDGAYFSVSGGPRIDLSTKGPLRRIFRAFVKAHRDSTLAVLTVSDVFDAGWFGERALPDALAGRVYSAISKLKRMGLGDVLTRIETGYRLDPRCCVIEESPLLLRREPTMVIHRAVIAAPMSQ